MLKHRFPGLPQSDLDISKIQFNRDVGLAILESYSRTIESLAHTVLSRIEDVVHADNQARNPPKTEKLSSFKSTSSSIRSSGKHSYTADDNQSQTPSSKTLLDFMGWDLDGGESERNSFSEAEPVLLSKPHFMDIEKKLSYTERLETLGAIRSPTARH